jgi:peptide/nickel transport system substrate-binding protein
VPKYGGILTLANRGDPPGGFDTMGFSNSELLYPSGNLNGVGNLVRPCRENVYKVCSYVAESWEANSDFTQWTFKVRDGILWHDGTSFTAEDAKFWVDLAFLGAESGGKTRAPAYYKAGFGTLKKTEVLPGNRLRLTLGESEPQYLLSLVPGERSIAHPRHLMQPRIQKGEVTITPLDVGLVSIGPFKILNHEKGSRVQVRRFERYWEKDADGRQLPYLDGIDFAILRDPSAMDAAFRVGRVEGGALGSSHTLSKERQAGYIRDLGDKVWFAEVAATRGGLAFNVLKPGPLQDLRVRRAISLWLDRQAAIPGALGGFGYVSSLLHPTNPFTSPDFSTWPGFDPATKQRDRAEAKRLLAAAGYANGFQMGHLVVRTLVHRGEFIHGQLAGLGVDVKLELRDNAGEIAGRLTLDFDTSAGGVALFSIIPEQLELGMTTYSISKYSGPKHEDPKIPEFFRRLKAAPSFDERVKVFRELERYYILEQAYAITIFGDIGVIPYRSHVKGISIPTESVLNIDFAATWLDK